MPGDRLNTHCVYKNTGSDSVPFGVASTQEMCMHFISYYPRVLVSGVEYQYCGAVNTGAGALQTVCGDSFLALNNPSDPDPLGGRNITFGVAPSMCPTDPTIAPTSSPTTGVHASSAVSVTFSTASLLLAAIFAL